MQAQCNQGAQGGVAAFDRGCRGERLKVEVERGIAFEGSRPKTGPLKQVHASLQDVWPLLHAFYMPVLSIVAMNSHVCPLCARRGQQQVGNGRLHGG